MKQESDVIERFKTILSGLEVATHNKPVYDVSSLMLVAAILTLSEAIRSGEK